MLNRRSHIFIAAAVLAALALAGCAAGRSSRSDHTDDLAAKVQSRIKPLVETLYLNTRELKEIYRDLRAVARMHAFRGSDQQLNYVQKTTLYVLKSHQNAFSQWEMLSIMEDIKPSAVKDYYTLRSKALEQALDEVFYDARFIKIYQARITQTDVRKDIDHALEILAANREIYGRILKAIAPLVHPSGPLKRL